MADINRRIFKPVHVMLLGALFFAPGVTASTDTSSLSQGLSQQRPAETLCRAPLSWYVEDIDPGFGFSRSEVITAVLRATEMWNQAADVELFNAAERRGSSGAIKVSLVFDHRQQLQDYVATTDAQIARLVTELETMDAQLSNERAQLEALREDITAMNQRIAAKAEQVDELLDEHGNRRGQVPQEVARHINQLQSEAHQLVDTHNAELIEFNQRQTTFNQSVNTRNRLAEQQSALAAQRNQQVQRREAEWQQRGLSSESGRHNIHIRTTNRGVSVTDETITIYSASNSLGLATILAHEFGHVIGINHVPGVSSIMSARLESNTPGAYPQQLSRDDIKALRLACQRVNPPR